VSVTNKSAGPLGKKGKGGFIGKGSFSGFLSPGYGQSVPGSVVDALSRIDPEFGEFARKMLNELRRLDQPFEESVSDAERLEAYRQFYEALKKRYEKQE